MRAKDIAERDYRRLFSYLDRPLEWPAEWWNAGHGVPVPLLATEAADPELDGATASTANRMLRKSGASCCGHYRVHVARPGHNTSRIVWVNREQATKDGLLADDGHLANRTDTRPWAEYARANGLSTAELRRRLPLRLVWGWECDVCDGSGRVGNPEHDCAACKGDGIRFPVLETPIQRG